MDKELYCDYSATTPVLPEVLVEMMPYFLNEYGNPSSVYTKGREARVAVENARASIAHNLMCNPEEIIFTSGGTESDNLAIKGIAQKNNYEGIYVTTTIEHPAVLNVFKELELSGCDVRYIRVDKSTRIKLKDVEDIIESAKLTNTRITLVSIMYANNELGSIQPIEKIAKMFKENDKNTIFHTDAVQAVGKVEFNLRGSNIDLLSASGHKFGAPKGIGFLYKRDNVKLNCQNIGGGQESNLRSGTENVASIVGMAKALEVHMDNLYSSNRSLEEKERYLTSLLKNLIDGININSFIEFPELKIKGVVNVTFNNVSAQSLLLYLDDKGIYISAGSACHSDSDTPSHVLKAIGLTDEEALSSIRISFDNSITIDEIQYLVENIKDGVDYIRNLTIST